jgi:hypothetical protein
MITLEQLREGLRQPTPAGHNGNSPAQQIAIDWVRQETQPRWVTVFERHLIAGFVIAPPGQREKVLEELRESPGYKGARLSDQLEVLARLLKDLT